MSKPVFLQDWRPISIPIESSLREALRKQNELAGEDLIVASGDRFYFVLSQGDIRRALLDGAQMDSGISSIRDSSLSAGPSTDQAEVFAIMEKHAISLLPVIDDEGTILGAWLFRAQEADAQQACSVLIMAGGLGSRLGPLTQRTPKPLIKIGDSTLLDRVINKCRRQGFNEIFISVKYLKDQIIEHVEGMSYSDLKIEFLEEEEPLGTAGSIALLPDLGKEDVILVNADVIAGVDFSEILRHHRNSRADLTVATCLHEEQIAFGVLSLDGTRVLEVQEKPSLFFPISAGIYVIGNRVRQMISAPSKIDMPTLISRAIDEELKVHAYLLLENWLDVGTEESLRIARQHVGEPS